MRIFTRYVLWEFLRIFGLSLLGFTTLILLSCVASEGVKEGLSLALIMRVVPFLIPESMRFAVPMAGLLGACSLFGRMAAENELLAIKAAGCSPWSVLGPCYALACVISIGTLWIHEWSVTWGRPMLDRLVHDSLDSLALGALRQSKSFVRDSFSITVQGVEGRRMLRPWIMIKGKGAHPNNLTIMAREARFSRDEDGGMSLVLIDTEVEGAHELAGSYPGEFRYRIPLGETTAQTPPSMFPLHELAVARGRQASRIAIASESLAGEAAFRLTGGDFEGLSSSAWHDRELGLDEDRYYLSRLEAEPWKRWALGFSCLSFVVAGAPLSVLLRKSDLVTTFGVAFLSILALYYPLLAYGASQAKVGNLPHYSVWMGNVALSFFGAWLHRKVYRF